MRPHHWAKNGLVFVPILLNHDVFASKALLYGLVAFVSFSLMASSIYLLNDIRDVEADRRHPTKCKRPLAAGEISKGQAYAMVPGLMVTSFALTALLPRPEGGFPTPACPEPSLLEEEQKSEPSHNGQVSEDGLMAALAQTQALQVEVRDLLLSQKTIKDFYTVAEVAKLLGKSEFTVREWCRNGRVRGQKQGSGRGKHQAWVISHEELQRLQREGLLPVSRSG